MHTATTHILLDQRKTILVMVITITFDVATLYRKCSDTANLIFRIFLCLPCDNAETGQTTGGNYLPGHAKLRQINGKNSY